MEQKSRSKIILEILHKIPYILNIKWSKDYQVSVYLSEEITKGLQEYIRRLLLIMCDRYDVVFVIVKKKNWWQKFLEKLK